MNSTNRTPIFIGVGVVALAVLAWLAFGFFGIQAAFIDNEVDEGTEDLFATTAVEESADAADEEVAEQVVEDQPAEEPVVEETTEAPEVEEAEADAAETDEAEAVTETDEPETEEPQVEEPPAEEAGEEPAEETVEEPAEPASTEPFTSLTGSFESLNGYSVTGDALVLENGTDQRFLRFENFVSDNGPDLKVYLRAANGDFVSLGDLSGNIGNQNYEIPADVDLSVFSSVQIWCERFSSGFGVATLS